MKVPLYRIEHWVPLKFTFVPTDPLPPVEFHPSELWQPLTKDRVSGLGIIESGHWEPVGDTWASEQAADAAARLLPDARVVEVEEK